MMESACRGHRLACQSVIIIKLIDYFTLERVKARKGFILVIVEESANRYVTGSFVKMAGLSRNALRH